MLLSPLKFKRFEIQISHNFVLVSSIYPVSFLGQQTSYYLFQGVIYSLTRSLKRERKIEILSHQEITAACPFLSFTFWKLEIIQKQCRKIWKKRKYKRSVKANQLVASLSQETNQYQQSNQCQQLTGVHENCKTVGHLGAQLVKHLRLGFGSGHDLLVCGIESCVGLHAGRGACLGLSLSLSLPDAPSLSHSLKINQSINKLAKVDQTNLGLCGKIDFLTKGYFLRSNVFNLPSFIFLW